MNTRIKNVISRTALGLTLLTCAVPTWAGFSSIPGVTTRDSGLSKEGWGSLQGTRYSSDTTQEIDCAVAESTAYSYVRCTAKDVNGTVVSCRSSDPRVIAAVHSMTSHSYIYFTMPSNDTYCSSVTITNGSLLIR